MMRLWREEALANGGSKEGDAWVEILVNGWDWWSGRIVSRKIYYSSMLLCRRNGRKSEADLVLDTQDLLRSILLPLDRSFVLVNTGTSNIL